LPTDDVGAVNLVIGKGTATKGVFSNYWTDGAYYLGIETEIGNDVTMGVTQLFLMLYMLQEHQKAREKCIYNDKWQYKLVLNSSANSSKIWILILKI
jgi:hypothetical protein